jgi:hypothetical protein
MLWGALPDERTVCNLLVQFAVSLRSKSRRTHNHILLSHLRLPQHGGQGPCTYFLKEQGGPVVDSLLVLMTRCLLLFHDYCCLCGKPSLTGGRSVYCENHTEHIDSGRNLQETHYVSATEPNRLMLFGGTVAVYCENHTEHTDTVRTSQEIRYSREKQLVTDSS